MTSMRRQFGDIVHLIEPKPEKRHLVAGILVSVLLYGTGAGKTVYDYWTQLKQWRGLLTIEVVDGPGAASGRPRVDVIELSKPLYYPPGLVKPRFDETHQEAARRRRERRRQQEDQKTAETRQEPVEQALAESESASNQQPDTQAHIQQIQEGLRRAQTLNIGPIREQIANIYKAQQEGKITINQIDVAVNFHIREDGAFTHVRLVESSGIPDVDNAALFIVDELSQLQSLAPLQETESVTLRLSIGQMVELHTVFVSASEAEAAFQVSQLNGLLAAARLLSAAQQKTRTVEFLSNIKIRQEGVNIVTSARVPRSEASQYLKKNLGSGT